MDASLKKQYSFDASALISLEVFYPQRIFPKVWEALDNLIDSDSMYVIDKVYDEVMQRDDTVAKWLKQRRLKIKKVFPNKHLGKTSEVVRAFPRLIDINNKNEQADPYLVADAFFTKSTIVTAEHTQGIPLDPKRKKDKLPNVCDHFSVLYINNWSRISQNEFAIRLFEELGLKDLG